MKEYHILVVTEEEEEEEEEEEYYDSRPNHQVQASTLSSSSNLMNPFGSFSSSSNSSHVHNKFNNTSSLFSNQHPPSLLFDPNLFQTTNFSHHQQPSAASFLNLDMLPSSQLQNQMLRSGPTSASSSSPYDPPPPSHSIKLLRSHNHHPPHPSSSIITPPPMPCNNYTTTSTSTVPTAAGVGGGGRNSYNHHNNPISLNPNQRSGHVASRNPKKRTRASRRAPTTVLTTDTSNFRAMVQEFTGIPPPPFSTPYSRSTFDLFRSNQFDDTTTTTTTTMTSLLYPLRPSPHKLPPFSSNYQLVGSSDLHQTTPSMMSQMLSALSSVPNKCQSTPPPVALSSLHHDVDHHQWGDMPSNTSHIINQDHHDDHKDKLDNLTSSRDHDQGRFDSWSCPTTTTD